jgi:hypothetical protein
MTHTQLVLSGFFEGIGLSLALAVVALCVTLFIYFGRRNDDDDGPPNAPGLLVEVIERMPFGFHSPKGARA